MNNLLLSQSMRMFYLILIVMRLINKSAYETCLQCLHTMIYVYVHVHVLVFLYIMFCSCIIVFRLNHNFSFINPYKNCFTILFSVRECHLYVDKGLIYDKLFLHL